MLAEDARLKVESERGVAHEALAVADEACKKAEEENSHLEDERLALVMEIGTMKDEFAAFQEKAAADRETMEAEFDSSGDALFNYGWNAGSFSPAYPIVLCQSPLPPECLVSRSSPRYSCR